MAKRRMPASSDGNLEDIVRQIVSHPNFQQAVNNATRRDNESNNVASGSRNPLNETNQNATVSTAQRTPLEEFQSLFQKAGGGTSLQQSPINLPQFQRRTSWGPSPSSRSRSGNQAKRNPYPSKVKNHGKKTTFSREVVLLRRPCDPLVRGGAKAELQRSGHVLSSFEFDKVWSANEVMEKLEEAFKVPLACIASFWENTSK